PPGLARAPRVTVRGRGSKLMVPSDGWIARCLVCLALQSCGSTSEARWGSGAEPAPSARAAGTGGDARPRSSASAPRVRWELAAELPTFRTAGPRVTSQHFTGEGTGEVLANSVAAAYPSLGPSRPVEPGSVLVEAYRDPGAEEVRAYLAMVKRKPGFDPPGLDWEYLVLDRTLAVERRGPLPACARCHAEAAHERLFGIPPGR